MPEQFSWSRTAPPQPELPGTNPWARQGPPRSGVARFLGGSPLAVVFPLLLASLVVGAFLVWLDISPFEIFNNLRRLVDYVWSLGFDAVREIGRYILAGAVIVVPLWLILRLMSFRGPR